MVELGAFPQVCVLVAFGAIAPAVTAAQVPDLNQAVLQIGAESSPDEEVFGRIHDIAVDQEGNVFVLDNISFELRWFGPDGEYRGKIGREGRGPEEFESLQGIAADVDGLIHVLDPSNLRISTFEQNEGELRLSNEVRVPPGSALCVLDSSRYVLFPNQGRLLHQINGEGRETASFGNLEESPPGLFPKGVDPGRVEYQNNRGWLACDESSGYLVFLHERLPIVRAFTSTGDLVWRTVLEDYHAVHWELVDGVRLRMGADPASGTAHTGVAVAVAGDLVYITLHEGSLEDPAGHLEVRVLRLSDGAELGSGPVPVRIAAVRGRRIYGISDNPYPRVLIFQ